MTTSTSTRHLRVHVRSGIDTSFGEGVQADLEALHDFVEHLGVLLGRDERDRETLGSETSGTSNTVQVGVRVGGKVVVDSQVDTLDIDTTSKDISSDTDTLVELFELLIPGNTEGKLVPWLMNIGVEKHTAPPGEYHCERR
jgi:hypothetical protein